MALWIGYGGERGFYGCSRFNIVMHARVLQKEKFGGVQSLCSVDSKQAPLLPFSLSSSTNQLSI